MKEIHAYRNNDGTYYIEMISEVKYGTTEIGGLLLEEATEAKVTVSRARIHIDALAFADEDNVLATLTFGGDEDESKS